MVVLGKGMQNYVSGKEHIVLTGSYAVLGYNACLETRILQC